MKQTVFTGSGVAIVTPMHADGSINYQAFETMLDVQIGSGTDAIVVCGTTGEAPTLNDEEHVQLIRCAVETVAGRVPVIAGTGSNDTRHAIAMSLEAKQAGADALLLVTPYYNKTSQTGLIRHFNAIADAAGMPVILYNVPSRTGVSIQPETYAELARHPLIVAAKEASGDLSAAARTAALCGEELTLYSGNDDQILPILSLGGKGVISVLANVAPSAVHEMCQSYFEGDVSRSRELQLCWLPLIGALFCDVNPMPVKEALNLLGVEAGPGRLPLTELGEEKKNRVRNALRDCGLLCGE